MTGLTIYKSSPLCPPPPNDINQQVYKQICNSAQNRHSADVIPPEQNGGNHVPETAVIRLDDRETAVRVIVEDGTLVEIPHQVQLYTTNDLLIHPLVSLTLASLGGQPRCHRGLPPLFFVASDWEVLRDWIVYT